MEKASEGWLLGMLVGTLGVLSLPLAAPAAIIASGPLDIVLSADLSQESGDLSCPIDMDGRTGTDFIIRLMWLTWNEGDDFRYDVRFESTGSGAFVSSDSRHVARLEEGTTINLSSLFRTCGTDGGTIIWYVSDDDASNSSGEWGRPGHSDVTTTGYIGVRVPPTAGGLDQFGWIRVTTKWVRDSGFSEPQLIVTVRDWATNIAPRTPIDAGRGPNYEEWATRRFSEATPSEQRAPHEDPDGDRLINLAEYAFLRNPESPDDDDPVLTVTREASEQPVLDYRRRSDDRTLAFVIESSVDLKSWIAVPKEDVEERIYVRIGNSVEYVRASYVGNVEEDLFFRLSVVTVP